MQNRNTKRIFPCEEILLDPIIPIPINKGRVKTGGSKDSDNRYRSQQRSNGQMQQLKYCPTADT